MCCVERVRVVLCGVWSGVDRIFLYFYKIFFSVFGFFRFRISLVDRLGLDLGNYKKNLTIQN